MKTHQFFLQMSGVPGSGKTTIAMAVSQATDAVIIDHDVTKSALLDAGVPAAIAGKASYEVLRPCTTPNDPGQERDF
jgi:predicted kinase